MCYVALYRDAKLLTTYVRCEVRDNKLLTTHVWCDVSDAISDVHYKSPVTTGRIKRQRRSEIDVTRRRTELFKHHLKQRKLSNKTHFCLL